MDIKKIIDRVHEETGTSLGMDDPVFVSVALNKVLLEDSVKILKNELETSVLKELPDLIIGLKVATVSANNIRNLNGDSENVQALIDKYQSAESLIGKKIDQINKAARLFNKPFLFTFSGAIIIGILGGVTIGHFGYKESLQSLEIEADFKKVEDALLKFELEHKDMMTARDNGVIFFPNAIVLPTKNKDKFLETKETGNLGYFYPDRNTSPAK